MSLFGMLVLLQTMWFDQPKIVVYIQPMGSVEKQHILTIKKTLEGQFPVNCIITEPIMHGHKSILNGNKTRIQAEKLLEYYGSNTYTLFVTNVDISYRKSAQYPDWGVIGLTNKIFGKSSIVSLYRIKHKDRNITTDRLKKVAIHEIGHGFGLNHCTKNKKCVMSSANGSVRQIDYETEYFCHYCITQLNKNYHEIN